MQTLWNRSRPFGNISVASEKRSFETSSGWEEDVENNDHKNLSQKLIDLANTKVSLDTIFSKYKVNLEPSHGLSGWELKGSCPFPDHNDKRPSFGYNPSVGIFNCFGCHFYSILLFKVIRYSSLQCF